MTEHYFSKDPQVKSEPFLLTCTLRGYPFRFYSDHGVFSKNEVDFGTRLLIESFRAPRVDGPFIDVGCGYGPIGLAIAKDVSDRRIHMIDVNERALMLAEKNAKENGVDNVVIYESDCFESVKERQFAAVLSNPPIRAGKKVVYSIFEEAKAHLVDRGELWIVIHKKQGAPSALEKLEQLFEEVTVEEKKKGYYVVRAEKIDSYNHL